MTDANNNNNNNNNNTEIAIGINAPKNDILKNVTEYHVNPSRAFPASKDTRGTFARPMFPHAVKANEAELVKKYGRDTGLRIQRLARAVEDVTHLLSDFTRAKPEPVASYKGKHNVQTFKFPQSEAKKFRGEVQFALEWITYAADQAIARIEATQEADAKGYKVEDCRPKESKGSRPKSLDFKVGDKVKLTTGASDMMMHMIYGMSEHPYGDDVKSINMDPNTTYLVTGFDMEQEEGRVMQIAHMVKVGDELQTHTWQVMRQTFKKVAK